VIALVPVSRFRITYEVAAGRPFSQLERMILRAIREGTTDLAELQKSFEVHPRLLIEGLVTLTHAGWLAVGGAGREGFVLTSEGSEAAGSDRPPSTTKVSPKRAFVVMERLTGALISNDEVRFASRKDLERVWEHAVRLSADIADNRLDQGQVQHLLPRRKGEWVRWIGPIDMMSKNAHWLPVNVDLDSGAVVGLPDVWASRLRGTIIDGARRLAATLTGEARARRWNIAAPRRLPAAAGEGEKDALRVPTVGWPTTIAEADLFFGGDEHEDLLSAALGEGRSILVASAFVNVEKLELLRSKLEAALTRGATIDLLWGYMADGTADGKATIEWLRKLAYNARDTKGQLRFNRSPSGSHAKLLLWDGPTGFRGCVGSYNWLSAQPGGGQPSNVTVRVAGHSVIAALARCAAALWSGAESEALASTGDRWMRIAGDVDADASRAEERPGNATIRLVLDREHEVVLREWCKTGQHRLLIASHRLGPASEARLVAAEVKRPESFAFDVIYGHSDQEGPGLKRVEDALRRSGGTLKLVPDLHAKVLVSDTSVCVTSYNFLSADPFGTAKNARELGLVIEGAEPVDWIWRKLRQT
jgi:hypothetical protein